MNKEVDLTTVIHVS